MRNTTPKAELLRVLRQCQQQAEGLHLCGREQADREAAADARYYLDLAVRSLVDVDDAGECRAIIV